jgi:hypothetical protein
VTASADLRRVAIEVGRVPDSGLYAAAKLVKRIAVEEGTRAGSPMAGKHRRPIKLRARDKNIRPLADGRAILIQGTPAGPWAWRTSGTAPHTTRRRKRGPMKKMTVHHPGSTGRGAWLYVIARAEDLVPRIFADAVNRAVE